MLPAPSSTTIPFVRSMIRAGRRPDFHIKKLRHDPEAKRAVDAYAAILFSGAVITGPGDLFAGIIANLVVEDFREAMAKTPAKRMYACKLMTKPGETPRHGAVEHPKEIVSYLSGGTSAAASYRIRNIRRIRSRGMRKRRSIPSSGEARSIQRG